MPCGNFKVTAQISANIAANAHINVEGSGSNCTYVYGSGISGSLLDFSYADATSSASIKDMTLLTDTAGTTNGIYLFLGSSNTLEAYQPASSIENVSFFGYNGRTNVCCGGSEYFQNGIVQSNVVNVSIVNVFFLGGGCSHNLCLGNGLNLSGLQGISYGGVTNVVNSAFNLCENAVYYGDWYQGFTWANSNATGCQNGLLGANRPTGTPDQASLANVQIESFGYGVAILHANSNRPFYDLSIVNSNFIINAGSSPGIGIALAGVNYSSVNNNMFGSNPNAPLANNTGVLLTSPGVQTLNISHNIFQGFATGIATTPSGNLNGSVADFNSFPGGITSYGVASGATGLIIYDNNGFSILSLPTCNAGMASSRFNVIDASAATYNGVLSGSQGNLHLNVECDGTSWRTN